MPKPKDWFYDGNNFVWQRADQVARVSARYMPDRRAHGALIAAAPELRAVAERWNHYRESILSKTFDANSPSLVGLLDDTRAALTKAGATT